MANPYQDGQQYGQDGAAYDQQSPTATPAPAGGAAGKKKRAYAGQAYEFGAGGNAALGGQPPANAAPPMMPAGGAAASPYGYPAQQPAYGMPQTPAYGDPAAQQPAAAAPYAQPAYGQPAGYQPAAPGYPQQDVAGMTQQFGQMGMGGQPPQPAMQQQQVPQPAQRLNPLVPVDISMQGQPFHVSDLDQPPPPCVLPPNVRIVVAP